MKSLFPDAAARYGVDCVVDNRVYTDREVWEAECQTLFSRVWNLVCHESEVAHQGDFLTAMLPAGPVIVVRTESDRIQAFMNVCRHRSGLVVPEERGNARHFRCPYHFWTYGIDGRLVTVPGEEAYAGTGFTKDEFGLAPIKCETNSGMVFISFEEPEQSLSAWMHGMSDLLERSLKNEHLVAFETKRIELPVNWKLISENVCDGYHIPFVHPFYRSASPPGPYSIFENGHAYQQLFTDQANIDPVIWEATSGACFPGMNIGDGYVANLFPNGFLFCKWNFFCVSRINPLSPSTAEMTTTTLGLDTDSPEERGVRTANRKLWFDDPFDLEDTPVLMQQQIAVTGGRHMWSMIARGSQAVEGVRGDDNRVRAFWKSWRRHGGFLDGSGAASGREAEARGGPRP